MAADRSVTSRLRYARADGRSEFNGGAAPGFLRGYAGINERNASELVQFVMGIFCLSSGRRVVRNKTVHCAAAITC